jgi:hypothetical protein
MLSVAFAEGHYAKCHYAECRYAVCHYSECHYAKCWVAGVRSPYSSGQCYKTFYGRNYVVIGVTQSKLYWPVTLVKYLGLLKY